MAYAGSLNPNSIINYGTLYMLQKLNERIQGFVAWLIIGLVALTFALFGVDYYMQSHHDAGTEIEVNDDAITKQAFELAYRRARQQRDPEKMTALSENQLKKEVMDEMILNKVSLQSARSYGFEVTVAQADGAIVRIPQFQEDGHFSSTRYQQALSGAFFTPESFQDEVRQGMLLNQQRFAFMGTAFALPSEINRFVKLYMQTRDYKYIAIELKPFIKTASVTDAELKTYYQQHQKEFLSPEKVSIEYIRLSMNDIKEKIKLSEEQIQSYYNENQNNYNTPAQWKVAHILFALPEDASVEDQDRVKENADKTYQQLKANAGLFEEKVSALSDDKISALNKGKLPWIVAGQSEFDKSLVSLTKPGQISEPVKSSHGFEIFKLVAFKPATIKPLVAVKTDIEQQLLAELAQTQYAQQLEQLSDLSYQTPDSLKPVAESLNLKVQVLAPFTRQGNESDELAKNKQVINAAFSRDVLDMGNNSEPIQVDNDSVIVLRVNKHIVATKKNLTEVKPVITELLATQKAEAQAKALGEQLLAANDDAARQAALIVENHLQWKEVKKATRETDTAPAAINELAFNLPQAGASSGHSLENGEYVLLHLNQINDGKVEALDNEQIASITQQIEASNGVMDYDLYINGLLSTANIVKH